MNVIKIISLLLFVSFITACATMRVDMIAEGEVKIAANKSKDVIFSKFDVHEHKGTTEIQIVVRPIERKRVFNVGSINILVTEPGGLQQNLVTDNARIDKHRIGSALQHAHFIVIVPRVIPPGSTLTVSYFPEAIKK
ncbi:MAG: hypothetical protein OEX07_06295 [Gammaproteobacteria bacterium]|nr:hypothetical protein [Gammaproteobacteria bacterium]